MRLAVAAAVAVAALVAGCGEDEPSRPEPKAAPLTIALDFVPNAVHAAIYEARRAGAPLRIRVPSGSTDSLKLLLARRADYAVVDIHDFGLALQKGEQLTAVAALVQQPLAAVITQRGVRRPRDLEGRRVGVTGLPSDDAVLRAVVEHDGGDFERVRRVTIGFSAVPALTARRVDAATAFWNAEGVALRFTGVRTREFRVADNGAPPYPELVVVRRAAEGGRDAALVRWLEDGTRSVLAEPSAVLSEIAEASQADPRLVQAQFEAVRPALSPPVRLNREVIEAWARFDVEFGILERAPDLESAFAF